MKIPFFGNAVGQWRMRHNPECQRALTVRYWKFLLMLSSAVVVLVVAFALWSIVSPWEPTITETSNVTDNTDTLRREQIQSVLDLYGRRKLQYDKLKNTPPTVTDPS